MIKKTKVKDGLYVAEAYSTNRTKIIILEGEKEILLSDMRTWNGFYNKWTLDHNYIVNYSRGSMANQIPLNVEAVYDINNHRLLDVSNKKIKECVENIFLTSRYFSLDAVLQEINEADLGLLHEYEKGVLNDYLTSGNKDYPHDSVVKYILTCYPKLKKYTNLDHPLTVLEYRTIDEKMDLEDFPFQAIHQDLSFLEKKSQDEVVYKDNLSKERKEELKRILAEADDFLEQELERPFRYDGDILSRRKKL